MVRQLPRLVSIPVLMGMVLLTSCTSRAFLERQEEAFAAIDRFNVLYLQAINEGDLELLGSLTTEDHLMISNGGDPLTGKVTLVDTMRGAFERFDFEETWTPVETIINGDLAYQRGSFTVHASPKDGGEAVDSSGTFQRTYQRQDNGEWYMIVDRHSSQ